MVLNPAFETNHTVFITFDEGTKQQNHLAVFRAKFDGASLSGGKVIFRSSPEKAGPQHSGGRMVFLPDGTFLVTVSDGLTYRYAAQDLDSDLGKSSDWIAMDTFLGTIHSSERKVRGQKYLPMGIAMRLGS